MDLSHFVILNKRWSCNEC